MAWKKRGNARNITEVIKEISRLTLSEVDSPAHIPSENIIGMDELGDLILKAVEEQIPVTIVGDYDADGITSTSILWFLLRYLGITPHIRLPRRYTEGYGLSDKVIEEIDEGIVLTVDNGIAAISQIQRAKDKGLTVAVLDHHLPGEKLPQADIVVDPHIAPDQSDFVDYCGAGLAYKLAQLLVDDKAFLDRMCSLAAIGTVADVVPLIGDNRAIVKDGLWYINRHIVPVGLLALLNVVGAYKVDEQTIGFTVGPLLNAPGRMKDNGAMQSLEMLITEDYAEAEERAYSLIEVNNQRKDLLKEGLARAHEILKSNGEENRNPICIYDPKLLAGLAGLVAGRLAEEYKTPAIVLTKAEGGQMKGSARSYGDVHLKQLLDQAKEYIGGYGGHAGAAGLSLPADNFEKLSKRLEELLQEYRRPDGSIVFYDLEITVDDIPKTLDDLKRYAPFGEANPRPVLRMDQVMLLPQAGKLYRTMGDNEEHIRLLSKDFSVIGFNMTESYMQLGEPKVINVLGFLSQTSFMGNDRQELEAIIFEKGETRTKKNTELQKQMLLHLFKFAEGGK